MPTMIDETAALVTAPLSETSLVLAETASGLFQIDYSVENVGKRFKGTKKKITWQFGSNTHASHQVVLCWSKRTGKQHVEMDDDEVYSCRQKGSSIVTHQWTTNDGMAMHVLASRVSSGQNVANLRKYELMIKGVAFSSLPYQDGRDPSSDEVTSIVTILYPEGYDPERFRNAPLDPIPSFTDQ